MCTQEAGTCWDKMNTVVGSARDLRKSMNAEKRVGPEFWTGAYTLIDTMENGIAVGEDQGAPRGPQRSPRPPTRTTSSGRPTTWSTGSMPTRSSSRPYAAAVSAYSTTNMSLPSAVLMP
ncbi:hypothetical protein ACFYRD_39445 [Streptomyces hirsutus]|uniref:hypothetical protein n=1 Tax=Streptomyces hirsutus TaxID=35620 RepID=UPI003690B234